MGVSLLGECHGSRGSQAPGRWQTQVRVEYKGTFSDSLGHPTSKLLSLYVSKAVQSLDLNLDFQLMNMSPSVQRASSPKCTVIYMTIEKKPLHIIRFNSNPLLYNDSFHFKLPNALFQRRQQGSGAVN